MVYIPFLSLVLSWRYISMDFILSTSRPTMGKDSNFFIVGGF